MRDMWGRYEGQIGDLDFAAYDTLHVLSREEKGELTRGSARLLSGSIPNPENHVATFYIWHPNDNFHHRRRSPDGIGILGLFEPEGGRDTYKLPPCLWVCWGERSGILELGGGRGGKLPGSCLLVHCGVRGQEVGDIGNVHAQLKVAVFQLSDVEGIVDILAPWRVHTAYGQVPQIQPADMLMIIFKSCSMRTHFSVGNCCESPRERNKRSVIEASSIFPDSVLAKWNRRIGSQCLDFIVDAVLSDPPPSSRIVL